MDAILTTPHGTLAVRLIDRCRAEPIRRDALSAVEKAMQKEPSYGEEWVS